MVIKGSYFSLLLCVTHIAYSGFIQLPWQLLLCCIMSGASIHGNGVKEVWFIKLNKKKKHCKANIRRTVSKILDVNNCAILRLLCNGSSNVKMRTVKNSFVNPRCLRGRRTLMGG